MNSFSRSVKLFLKSSVPKCGEEPWLGPGAGGRAAVSPWVPQQLPSCGEGAAQPQSPQPPLRSNDKRNGAQENFLENCAHFYWQEFGSRLASVSTPRP